MRLDVITIFPEYLDPFRHALLGKAIEKNIIQVGVHNLRDWATDVHKSVDDTPYGGGPGMVMKPEVWGPALDDIAVGVADAPLLESAQPHLIKSSDADVHGGGDQEGVDKKPLLIPPVSPLLKTWRGPGLRRTTLCSPVGATRALTSASSTMPLAATESKRSRSETMCSSVGK